jgi:hypothetical protein
MCGTKIALRFGELISNAFKEYTMKSSKPSQIQTTVGELISVLYDETQDLLTCKTNESQLVVAYILNDLARNRFSANHSRPSTER